MANTSDDILEVRSSRLWATLHFSLTRWLFPARLISDRLGISTNTVDAWYRPWDRSDEHLPMSHVAQVIHDRGLVWDSIRVESSGGLNPLSIDGVPKSAARYFVEHVRERLNEVAPVAQQQQRR